MNSTSPSLLAKILAAVLGFGLMAAVPLLTVYYVARAHAEPPAPISAVAQCPRSCPAPASACAHSATGCATPACSPGDCVKN